MKDYWLFLEQDEDWMVSIHKTEPSRIALSAGMGYDYESALFNPAQAREVAAALIAAAAAVEAA